MIRWYHPEFLEAEWFRGRDEKNVGVKQRNLVVARTLLGAPGLTTRNKKLLGAPGIASKGPYYFGTNKYN